MGREIERLTALKTTRLKKPGLYPDGAGLYCQVSKGGVKSWLFRFMRAGRARAMGLGPLYSVTLAEARQRAQDVRRQLLDGLDPIEERRARLAALKAEQPKLVTFDEAAEQYIRAHAPGWRNAKHGKQWRATLKTYVARHFGTLPVAAVDTALVLRALEPIWVSKPETATRVRGRIESILDWAATRGYRAGENPARWRGHLENLLPRRATVRRVRHHPALPYGEIGAFIAALRQQTGIAPLALEFLILTAARTGEVLGARWPEIDLDNAIWLIPADRMKGGRAHRVPLAPRAVEILRVLKAMKHSAWVFPGAKRNKPLSNMALLAVLRRMGRGNVTAHGFRSSFRDWAGERTSVPREVAEAALAHAISDRTEAAYLRADFFARRRRLMNAWAAFCDTVPATGAVVQLRRP